MLILNLRTIPFPHDTGDESDNPTPDEIRSIFELNSLPIPMDIGELSDIPQY